MSLTIDGTTALNSFENPYVSAPPAGLRGFSDLNPTTLQAQKAVSGTTNSLTQYDYTNPNNLSSNINSTTSLNSFNSPSSLNSFNTAYSPNSVNPFTTNNTTNALNSASNTNIANQAFANATQANSLPFGAAVNANSTLNAPSFSANEVTQLLGGINPVNATSNSFNSLAAQNTLTNTNSFGINSAFEPSQELAAQTLNNQQIQSELQNFGTNAGVLNGFNTPVAFPLNVSQVDPYTNDAVSPIAAIDGTTNNPIDFRA